jgi:hypothetical protein
MPGFPWSGSVLNQCGHCRSVSRLCQPIVSIYEICRQNPLPPLGDRRGREFGLGCMVFRPFVKPMPQQPFLCRSVCDLHYAGGRQMESRKSSQSVTALQSEKAYLKQLVSALKAENSKLQKKVAHLEAKDVTSQSRIKALEKLKAAPPAKPLSDIEAARRIAFILNRGGFELVDGKAAQVRPPGGPA